MKETPILFSVDMVRAILEGRKTQTRRLIKPQPPLNCSYAINEDHRLKCPFGTIGDHLWVRENGWEPKEPTAKELREGADTWPRYSYDADGETQDYKAWGWKRRPSIHMPRWASRITLEITDVFVQRVQDIGKDGRNAHDVLAEGVTQQQIKIWDPFLHPDDRPATAFGGLWDRINGKGSFRSNPWVWVIGFKRILKGTA